MPLRAIPIILCDAPGVVNDEARKQQHAAEGVGKRRGPTHKYDEKPPKRHD
jgi:hypothetical protein